MKKYVFILIVILSIIRLNAQENILISENENIKIFESHISLKSDGNIWPAIYNEGIIYASNKRSNKYYFKDFDSKIIRFKTNYKYSTGPFAVYKNEIYFTGLTSSKNNIKIKNNAIYKGLINDFEIVEIEPLTNLNPDFSFTDPSISKDGKRMIVVSNEKGYPHLLELIRNDKSEWIKGELIYISNPKFDILNPTIYNENTIYFSSNISSGKILEQSYTIENGKYIVNELKIENSHFNIYKTVKRDNIWSLPVKVEMFNSEFDDLSVIFLNEKSGYINTYRYNNSDNIYYFELKK